MLRWGLRTSKDAQNVKGPNNTSGVLRQSYYHALKRINTIVYEGA